MFNYKIIAPVLIVLALTALAACGDGSGSGGGKVPGEPKGFVIEGSNSVEITNVRALLQSSSVPSSFLDEDEDPEDFKDDWRDEWEDKSRALATNPDAVTQEIAVDSNFGRYYITEGEFEFGAVKNELEDQGYDDGKYREWDIWESENGNAVALFESNGVYVYGSTEAVKEIIKAVVREEGFMSSEADLRRAVDKVDSSSLQVFAEANCSGGLSSSPNGCRAFASAITGGDEDSLKLTSAAVFSSERRAEAGVDDIEDQIYDNRNIDADLDEIEVDGEIVTFKVTIYR